MAKGGRYPGDSRTDSLWVKVRPGEGFVHNEALAVWDRLFGPGFFEGVNNPWSQAGQKIRQALSGAFPKLNLSMPQIPKMTYATGGRASAMPNLGRLDLAMGKKPIGTIMGKVDVLNTLKDAIRKERLMKDNA
jgi:hypothetical protein